MIYFRQCLFCRNGNIYHRGWIEEYYTTLKKVQLLGQNGEWYVWEILEVGKERLTEEEVAKRHHAKI
jgi:hypothetical protein